ncbi:flagellar biosynthetic protein FlhB [Kineococcus xinjiangensis]|uniref:Flagellar biosynthetic protein FlhB n=1 Tax=Kineococcus xinjiangensis TaxID=512762 RepID=A0A2S6IK46_9ACTN|nr:EscU/YscU/HrcU family type III secretion system export apparatus switch protein [Kineococcus xinjiangensis]PPK94530.1 flagellar biosynthetic protein FlhB [Kineococcus xinjiangensis]
MSGEKTEKPTPKKLEEARKEGNTPRTPDLSAWLCTGAGALMIPMSLSAGQELTTRVFRRLPDVAAQPEPARVLALLVETFAGVPAVVAPVALATVLAALVAGAAQGSTKLATKKLTPKLSMLNPINGFKQHWGPQAIWEGTKTLLKAVLLGLVLWSVVKGLAPALVGSAALPLTTILATTAASISTMIIVVVVVGLLIAAADYAMARRRVMNKLKMSKHDIKQEHKNSEGDPLLKGAIRSKQMAMSRNRMMADVASADAVIVNPTHIAVAVRYDPANGAPRVVAKGSGIIADKIREKARENGVPLVRDVPLARQMYKDVKIGDEIPVELYAAVAKVLAFVMNLRTRGALRASSDPHTVPG